MSDITPSLIGIRHSSATEEGRGLRLLLVALAIAVLFHGGLLPFTHGNTYDAFIHMFFGDSYYRSWVDPWEPRWYTGFATTSYPPGTHMMIAGLMNFMPLRAAFVVVQTVGLLLLTVGTYRFSLLWVSPRASGYAANLLVLSSAISETIHLFGQLPTIFSLGIFLNGLPHIYRFIVSGRKSDLFGTLVLNAATTACHHVTTIFGGVLFVVPLALHALRASWEIAGENGVNRPKALTRAFGRGMLLVPFMLVAVVVTVFPYWSWSINDPITQVPIPHGSRENFLERPDLGFIFFLVPWGTALLFLPFVGYKTFTSRLWPLGMSALLCFVLGTGGTTPISRAILHGAFDILTLDRFTFWATVLVLPFLGLMIEGLLHGRSGEVVQEVLGRTIKRLLLSLYFLSLVLTAVFPAVLPTFRPTQPDFIDPAPIVRFLEEDKHDSWRYLTLGFGDQFAYLSANTKALAVDGNYHSARRLPDLTRYSVERLENAKYLGVPGLGSLKQFLVNAESYNLKYVFANDAFYDPLLHFTGWSRLLRLGNGITVWEKPDIPPLSAIQPRRDISPLHMVMWAYIPPTALVAGFVFTLLWGIRFGFVIRGSEYRPHLGRDLRYTNIRRTRWIVSFLAGLLLVSAGLFSAWAWQQFRRQDPPQVVIEKYFSDLDFRRFEEAYARLDPISRPDFGSVMFNWRWRGGLIASFGKLVDIEVLETARADGIVDWAVSATWMTALDLRTETLRVRTVERDGAWYLSPSTLRMVQAPQRLQRNTDMAWNVVGRRQPRPDTDLHGDLLDRPRLSIQGARLVVRDGRYSVVGQIGNMDMDPAHISLFTQVYAGSDLLSRQAAGEVLGQRLLPAEVSGFRTDFEGVLSLEDAEARGGFDPKLFIPPEFAAAPETANVEARALATGKDLYRAVALNGVTIEVEEGAPVLSGLAVNTGTEAATLIRVIVLLFDTENRPIWAEAGYVETNIYPGQSAPFTIPLPPRDQITVVSDLTPDAIIINGSSMDAVPTNPEAFKSRMPLTGIPGYGAFGLHVSTMTYDPNF